MSSFSACVSADNKVFYIFDEGSTYSPYLPCRWKLVARDAFSGVLLWKRSIDPWEGHLRDFRSGPTELCEKRSTSCGYHTGPLSEVNTTSVFCSKSSCFKVARISPTF